MNREQRRAEVKRLQKKGVKRGVAKRLVEKYYTNIELEEGTTVKLNYELMSRHPDWKIQRDDFKAWVTEHKDEYFTVEWDEQRKAQNSLDKKLMVCLKEDTTEPKWLFHTDTLIHVASAKVKLDSGEEIKVNLDGVTDPNDARIQEAVNEALAREKALN
jgi:hypothetical protein